MKHLITNSLLFTVKEDYYKIFNKGICMKNRKIWTNTVKAVCVFMLVFGLVPMLFGFINLGTIAITLYGLLLMFYIKFEAKNTLICIYRWFVISLSIFGICFMVLSIWAGYFNNYHSNEPATVIVMGCEVRGDQPSLMLKERLNVAYKELINNPDYKCIVSGGHTVGDPLSEAMVMRNYLVEKGIDSNRIYLEDQATNTQENIAKSISIIKQNQLPENIIIATDAFHQLRANYYVRENNYQGYATSSLSGIGLVPGYYAREVLAFCEIFLKSIGMI